MPTSSRLSSVVPFLLMVLLRILAGSPVTAATLAKFEPAAGCYIGAFIEKDEVTKGDIETFEALTRKKHASYFTYVGYGQPFPARWVDKVKNAGAAPHIAFEPNGGLLQVEDNDYLRWWARDAARCKCPIFLRWASEMNGPWTRYSGNPALYKEKFRLVAQVMREEAPNVAMVWTPFAEPTAVIAQYYPGDEWVDWVGVNIYSVYVHNGNRLLPAWNEDPVDFLRFIYDNYASRKPIHISEFAATNYCKGSDLDTVDFAIKKMTRFYKALREEFPRVKSVNWFCVDTIRAGLANNDYSLLEDGRVLATYINLIQDDHFLSKVSFDADGMNRQTTPRGTTVNPANIPNPKALDDQIANAGAVATQINEPWLRGLKNGEVVHGELALRVQLPMDMQPKYIMWDVDGRTVALTNTPPFHVSVPAARFAPGQHTAQVMVMTADGVQHDSQQVQFVIPEE